MVTKDEVLAALSRIKAPGTGTNIVAADMVRALSVEDGRVRFVIEAPSAQQGAKLEPLRQMAVATVEALTGRGTVQAVLTAPATPKRPPSFGRQAGAVMAPEPIPGVKAVLPVASGKGGVGKSTVAANLAVAFALQGLKTGLLDADIHGPSQPRMMGLSGRPGAGEDGKTIIPLRGHGVTVMSIGFMMDEGTAAIWRGPMLMGALQQLTTQVRWGELDVLVIDLPPGTGDVQLSLAQKTVVKGAVMVSTPQDVALLDVRKAMNMFEKVHIPILGIIENMSAFVCPNCGHETHIFGHGGARAEAERLGLPFLGEVPLSLATRISGDEGIPIVKSAPDSPEAQAFRAIAARLAGEIGAA